MDKFKWYSSYSGMMDNIALGGRLWKKSFLQDAFETLNPQKSGINSLLFVYMRVNERDNRYRTFYEIFFSVDGKLLEIKDFNPSIDGDPFYIIDASSRKRINNNNLYNGAMDFILEYIINRDAMNIRSQIRQNKAIAILQVDYNEYIYSTNEITSKLRRLFEEHFVDELGPMQ